MDARIRILLRIIEEHGGVLRLTSKQIGGLLGLGEARVLRLFSRDVGKPLRRYLLEVKMARAAQLLKNATRPIKAVASDCGYTVISNFYRDFKRVHGMSPMQMRLRHMSTQIAGKLILIKSSQLEHFASEDSNPAGRLHLVANSGR